MGIHRLPTLHTGVGILSLVIAPHPAHLVGSQYRDQALVAAKEVIRESANVEGVSTDGLRVCVCGRERERKR
jgi:hypothetical protein